ncbi:hypothetical protein [Aeromonas hydrophila]|uniref:hypothetical protein n=1 Tax=Aeromonas hydrophila TaxID=644 RepID=UPI003EC4C0D0
MKTSLLLVSLLILTACNDNHSQAPVPSVPVVTPPVVEPPVEPPVVTPPTEPPIEPVPTHTRSELSVRLDVTTHLGQGAALLLRQAATGIAVSGEVEEERPLVMTLPAGLLLDQPLELVGSDGSYILRAATARVAELGATALSARRADAPALRLDEEETALFLLADRNGDSTLDQGEWGQLAQIRLQQQPLIQDYATLLLAQRQPGAELNYPDSWQMLLALRADQGERSWYRRSNSAPIEAARLLLYPAQPSQPDEPETADLLRLDEQGRLTSGTDWRCLHDVRSPAGVKGSQYWLHASGSSVLPQASRAELGVVPTGCGAVTGDCLAWPNSNGCWRRTSRVGATPTPLPWLCQPGSGCRTVPAAPLFTSLPRAAGSRRGRAACSGMRWRPIRYALRSSVTTACPT